MTNKLNDDLMGRLYNWKFNSAYGYLDGSESEEVVELIDALGQVFGNTGGMCGAMATIVGAALASIGIDS